MIPEKILTEIEISSGSCDSYMLRLALTYTRLRVLTKKSFCLFSRWTGHAFKFYDENKDLRLSVSELKKIRELHKHTTVEEVLAEKDKDGDNHLNLQEFNQSGCAAYLFERELQ